VLGQPQVGRVRLPCLGIAVEVEQAVGPDQLGVQLAVGDRACPVQRRRSLAGQVQCLGEPPLPPAGAGDGLQPVGHRNRIAAGHALGPGAFGGPHGRSRPARGEHVQALRGEPVEPGALGAAEAAAVQCLLCLLQSLGHVPLIQARLHQDPAQPPVPVRRVAVASRVLGGRLPASARPVMHGQPRAGGRLSLGEARWPARVAAARPDRRRGRRCPRHGAAGRPRGKAPGR